MLRTMNIYLHAARTRTYGSICILRMAATMWFLGRWNGTHTHSHWTGSTDALLEFCAISGTRTGRRPRHSQLQLAYASSMRDCMPGGHFDRYSPAVPPPSWQSSIRVKRPTRYASYEPPPPRLQPVCAWCQQGLRAAGAPHLRDTPRLDV